MQEPTQAESDAFLDDLTRLTKKHKIVIDGCGCCYSPFMGRQKIANNARYTAEAKEGREGERVNLTWG